MADELVNQAQRFVAALERWHTARRCGTEALNLRRRGLSLSHLRVLHELGDGERRGMKDLAEQLRITPPSLTGLMRRLEAQGLVERLPCAHDQRRSEVGLSPTGEQLMALLQRERLTRLMQLLGGLDPAERRLFIDLLERAVAQQ